MDSLAAALRQTSSRSVSACTGEGEFTSCALGGRDWFGGRMASSSSSSSSSRLVDSTSSSSSSSPAKGSSNSGGRTADTLSIISPPQAWGLWTLHGFLSGLSREAWVRLSCGCHSESPFSGFSRESRTVRAALGVGQCCLSLFSAQAGDAKMQADPWLKSTLHKRKDEEDGLSLRGYLALSRWPWQRLQSLCTVSPPQRENLYGAVLRVVSSLLSFFFFQELRAEKLALTR